MAAARAYDYVILGAGSAGCVLANRLSADPAVRVLLVEAGGPDRNPLIRVPLMAGYWFAHRHLNWGFQTEPQPHLAGRRIAWPRGKVWGGSSAINGMIYVRGHPRDYDGWAETGLPGWDWDGVLPFYRRAEAYAGGGDALHGGHGPLPVSLVEVDHPLSRAFLRAGVEAGHPACLDFTGADPVGVGHYHFNVRGGERWSCARAYLRPVLRRPNLRVMSHAHVLRVLLDGGRATGVEVARGRGTQRILAAQEVIVASGAIGSPAILMHSGIGAPARLRATGIAPQVDLPGVGRNLHDHLQVAVAHASTASDYFYELRRADRVLPALVRAVLHRTGPATRFPLTAGAFLKTDAAQPVPDVQVHYILGAGSRGLRHPLRRRPPGFSGFGYTGSVCQTRPESRGEVFLKTADPRDAPGIQPNYLAEERDRAVLREGVAMVRDLFSQAGFDPYRGDELAPGPDARTPAQVDEWIARTAFSIYHPVGTCRMGLDADAVVDGALRVRGVERLRVVDASVMPRIVGGNTHGATVMIAEKAAALILGQEERSQAHVPVH